MLIDVTIELTAGHRSIEMKQDTDAFTKNFKNLYVIVFLFLFFFILIELNLTILEYTYAQFYFY